MPIYVCYIFVQMNIYIYIYIYIHIYMYIKTYIINKVVKNMCLASAALRYL